MNPEVVAAWSAICRRALKSDVDDCPPAMVPAAVALEAVYAVMLPLGPREGSAPYRDGDADEVIMAVFRDAFASGDFLLRILRPAARDTVRDLGTAVAARLMFMDGTGLDYGPVPDGLHGRDLGLAVLACEILQTQDPQRWLAERSRQAH